jgi:hypothetical protein
MGVDPDVLPRLTGSDSADRSRGESECVRDLACRLTLAMSASHMANDGFGEYMACAMLPARHPTGPYRVIGVILTRARSQVRRIAARRVVADDVTHNETVRDRTPTGDFPRHAMSCVPSVAVLKPAVALEVPPAGPWPAGALAAGSIHILGKPLSEGYL